MNIKIPVSEAIKRIETRIKEIKKAQKENEKIKKENEESVKKFRQSCIEYVQANLYSIEPNLCRGYKSLSLEFPLPTSYQHPISIPNAPTPAGNIADLERALGLLKITTSVDVNLKAVKGLAEMV